MLLVEIEHFNPMLSSLCGAYIGTYHRWTTSVWSCGKAAISLSVLDFTARLTQKSCTAVRTSPECSVLQLSCLKLTYLYSSTTAEWILKKPQGQENHRALAKFFLKHECQHWVLHSHFPSPWDPESRWYLFVQDHKFFNWGKTSFAC